MLKKKKSSYYKHTNINVAHRLSAPSYISRPTEEIFNCAVCSSWKTRAETHTTQPVPCRESLEFDVVFEDKVK